MGSATGATLGTGGWLTLTLRGLAPQQICRAFLGARTTKLTCRMERSGIAVRCSALIEKAPSPPADPFCHNEGIEGNNTQPRKPSHEILHHPAQILLRNPLHTNWMYICTLDGESVVNLHRNVRTRPTTFLRLIEPFREDIVI